MPVKKIIFAFCFLAMSIEAQALSYPEALQAAHANNPELAAARLRWQAAAERIAQQKTPESPQVMLERMYAPDDKNPVTGAAEKNVAISQSLPFPTALYYRGRAAAREADMAQARYLAVERDVLARVKSAYAMLYLSRHSLHIFEDNIALMRKFAQAAESKYAVGKASQGDVLKAQVELSRLLNMRVTLEQEQETSRAMLNTLLNRDPDAPLSAVDDFSSDAATLDFQALRAKAMAIRPELKEAQFNTARAEAMVGAARAQYFPDIMLQYRRRDMMSGDTHDAMVGFSVPLWFWKQNAMLKEARAEKNAADAELAAMQNMTQFEVKNLFVKAQTAARLVELYRSSVLPQSEQALNVTEAAYRSDKAGFLDLLEASRTLLGFRLEHYQHIADYQILKADLERTIGTNLEDIVP